MQYLLTPTHLAAYNIQMTCHAKRLLTGSRLDHKMLEIMITCSNLKKKKFLTNYFTNFSQARFLYTKKWLFFCFLKCQFLIENFIKINFQTSSEILVQYLIWFYGLKISTERKKFLWYFLWFFLKTWVAEEWFGCQPKLHWK